MESGQGSLVDLRSMLASTDAEVLVKAVADSGTGVVRHIDAIVAPPTVPSGWEPRLWRYKLVTFVAGQTTSESLAAAFEPSGSPALPLMSRTLVVPPLGEQLRWERKPGRARWDSMVLTWPTTTFELSRKEPGHSNNPSGYLIGDDCPSFFAYQEAFRAFFYGEYGPGAGQVPQELAVVRVIQASAWIERVLVTPTSLEVRLSGAGVAGLRLELNSPTWRTDTRVAEAGVVTLPMPDGLPPAANLYLSRDMDWLDFRAIGQYPRDELASAGVEIVLPDDPVAEMQALLARGEGQQTEFKRQVPDDSVDSKRTVFKTVAAFANGRGGSIAFGIEKDEATVCGLDSNLDLLQERDRLAQLTRAIVTPAPDIEVRQYEHGGKSLLVLSVDPGENPPYGITLPGRKDKPVEFYIRRDATTFPATSDEVRNVTLATAPQPTHVPPWGVGG